MKGDGQMAVRHEERFFQVFWELKVLVWGLLAIPIAYAATYWLYIR